jgi:hypothetical protein
MGDDQSLLMLVVSKLVTTSAAFIAFLVRLGHCYGKGRVLHRELVLF